MNPFRLLIYAALLAVAGFLALPLALVVTAGPCPDFDDLPSTFEDDYH